MSERDTIKFLNVMDSIGILQNIIRSFELSKRLLKENVQMTTLLYRFSKKPLIHCEITDIIKDNLENYKKYFPELKNKYTLAIIEYLFRFSFLIGRIPFLYWKFNNFFKKNKTK